jgi:hypothetical protein
MSNRIQLRQKPSMTDHSALHSERATPALFIAPGAGSVSIREPENLTKE